VRFNIKLPADKENELWQLVDANSDGDISYQEFKVEQIKYFAPVSVFLILRTTGVFQFQCQRAPSSSTSEHRCPCS
jgi:hypothetical protein